MFVASGAAFRLGQETLQRPLEFIGKLVEHHAQSQIRKFLMLTVWPSITDGFLTTPPASKIRQKVNKNKISDSLRALSLVDRCVYMRNM